MLGFYWKNFDAGIRFEYEFLVVTIISLKLLYYALQEEGIDLRSLNAQSFVVLGPYCVANAWLV